MSEPGSGHLRIVLIPIDRLVTHPMNPNVMSREYRRKLLGHIRRTGKYPYLIVRELPDGTYQILDGAQRFDVLRELGVPEVWCCVWPATDDEALLLLGTFNQLAGSDDPSKRAALLMELATHQSLAELAALLPEDEAQLEAILSFGTTDLESIIAGFKEQAERLASESPQLFSFPVDPADAPTVEAAITRAMDSLDGPNRRGRALVILARTFLGEPGESRDD